MKTSRPELIRSFFLSLPFFIFCCLHTQAQNTVFYTQTFDSTTYASPCYFPSGWTVAGVGIGTSGTSPGNNGNMYTTSTSSSGSYGGASLINSSGSYNLMDGCPSGTSDNPPCGGTSWSCGTINTGYDVVTTPNLTLPCGYTNINIDFGCRLSSTSYQGSVTTYYSTNGGTSWTKLDSTIYNSSGYVSGYLAYSHNGIGNWNTLDEGTTTANRILTGATGGGTLKLKFSFHRTATGGNFRIDDITLMGTAPSNTIAAPSFSPTGPYCVTASAGASTTLSFTSSGTFNTGNVYTAQLSSATGSFGSPVSIGTLTSTSTTGLSINATIPANTATGTGYKVRIVSSCPSTSGTSTSAFTIDLGSNSIVPTTTQNLTSATNGSTLTVTEGYTPTSRQWYYGTASGGPYSNSISGATSTTYTPNFTTSGNYYVVCESVFGTPCSVTQTSNQVLISIVPNTPGAITFFCPASPTSGTVVLNWTAPSGSYDGVVIFARATSAPTYTPSGSGSSLTGANNNFSSAATYGTDKLVYSGTGTTLTVSGLTAGTTYYFRAFAYQTSYWSAATASASSLPLVPDVTSASVTSGNSQLSISWTNPSCYDEILVIGTSNSSVTSTPSGNGSSYTANQVFATSPSGTDLNSREYDVYQSMGNSVVVLGLANATTYNFKIFVLRGTTWSSGVTVSGTPNPSTGDYQSRANGNWSNYLTWSRYNGSAWVNATSGQYPEASTVSVIIQNTVTLDNANSPYEINNLIVQSGSKLYCNTATGTVLYVDIYGNLTCTGTIGNSPSNDDIGINVDGANCIIAGTGTCACSRIRKDNGDNSTTNLTVEMNISFLWNTSSESAFLYDNEPASIFNVTTAAGTTLSCTNTALDVAIDGSAGAATDERGGTYTINGTLSIAGILHLTTQNSTDPCTVVINNGGVINVANIDASASNHGAAPSILTINSGGLLNITGTAGISPFSTTHNIYNLNTGSTVQYSASGAQTIETGMGAYSYLTCSGSGDKTPNNDITINGDLVVNAAIFDCLTSSPNYTNMYLYGNMTLQNGATMSTHCYNHLKINPSGTSTQTFNGGTNSIQCYNFASVASSGGVTLTGGSSQTTLNIGNNFSLDYTGSALFTDNGNTIIVGNNVALGSAASNFSFTGTVKFICTGSSNPTLSDYSGSLICPAQLYNLTIDAAGSSQTLEIMPSPSGGQNLYINGSVNIANSNSEGTNFNPNGNILNVGGNWTTYGHGGLQATVNGNSTIVFAGTTGAQTITSNSGADYEVFYNMKVANSAGVTLSSIIHVDNQLTLTSGIITTGSNEVDVISTASNSVTSYSSASYINGNLRRYVATATSYDFPIGTSSNYELATFNLTSFTGSLTNILGTFTGGTPSQPSPTTCFINSTPIGSVLNAGYWSLTPDNFTTVSYDVTLNETGYTNFSGSATELGIIKRHNSTYAWAGTNLLGGTGGTQGYHSNSTQSISSGVATAKRTSVASFSDYGIGFGVDPLPINLVSFNAAPNGNDALLTWETESEYNNKYFAIERSGNAIDFMQIGQVAGKGTTTEESSYSFPDNSPLNGINYYRLRQVDEDSTAHYTSIEAVQFNDNIPNIHIYPVPANASLLVNGLSSETVYVIYDITGRLIQSGSINQQSNTIDVRSLSTGIYFLNLNNNDLITQQKFIKE